MQQWAVSNRQFNGLGMMNMESSSARALGGVMQTGTNIGAGWHNFWCAATIAGPVLPLWASCRRRCCHLQDRFGRSTLPTIIAGMGVGFRCFPADELFHHAHVIAIVLFALRTDRIGLVPIHDDLAGRIAMHQRRPSCDSHSRGGSPPRRPLRDCSR